jgi:hypothetical protein
MRIHFPQLRRSKDMSRSTPTVSMRSQSNFQRPVSHPKAARQILDIMHPGREIGVGIDLIWQYCESDIPGAGASNGLCDGENVNGHCLSVIEAREAH